jgi:hypothetical protein
MLVFTAGQNKYANADNIGPEFFKVQTFGSEVKKRELHLREK